MTEEEFNGKEKLLEQEAEKLNAELQLHCSFEAGVKFITGERRLDRAMPWFRRFARSLFQTEKQAEAAIASYRTHRLKADQLEHLKGTIKDISPDRVNWSFTPNQVGCLRDQFAVWKEGEQSRVVQRDVTRQRPGPTAALSSCSV